MVRCFRASGGARPCALFHSGLADGDLRKFFYATGAKHEDPFDVPVIVDPAILGVSCFTSPGGATCNGCVDRP